MLHATKQSRVAWAGFDARKRVLQEPAIWESALVGHHLEGSSESQVIEWLKQGDLQSIGNDASYAAMYLAPASIARRGNLMGLFNDPNKHRVRSQLSYFVDAYRAIKLRDYRGAKRAAVGQGAGACATVAVLELRIRGRVHYRSVRSGSRDCNEPLS
ncbi:MAG: hypothetical protein WA803_07440 [Steroidobacteraceae bacterium]